jgi:hypothetical protein
MSVTLFKDDFYRELEEKAKAKNLTLAAGSSKTTVSFTNNFTLVPPVVKNNTEINIFRPLANCTGTPCNVSAKIQTTQELILCECLKADNTNDFFKKLAETTTVVTNSTTTIGNTIANGTLLVFVQPEKTLGEFRFWLTSAMVCFVSMGFFFALAIVLEGRVISPGATGFVNSVSTRFAVSTKIQESKLQRVKNDAKPKDDKTLTSNSSEFECISDLKRAYKDNESMLKCLDSPNVTKPFSAAALFCVIYLTHHFVLCIFFSKGTHYSRKSMISMIYTRMSYALALSMLFNLGYDKSGHTDYQVFVLKSLVLPILISPILFFIKLLMKDDNKLNFLEMCKRKSNADGKLENEGRGSNTVFPRSQSQGISDIFQDSNNPDSPTSTIISGGSSPAFPSDGTLTSLTSIKPSPPAAFKKSAFMVVRVVLSYTMCVFLVPLSAIIVVSVANSTSKSDTWPVGYWYILNLAYDLTLGQAPMALLQFGLFKAFMNPEKKFARFVSKYLSWMMNSDVKEIAGMYKPSV